MTREDIMEVIESTESIDSKEFDSGRIFDLYNVEVDGVDISVIDSDELGKERITMVLKDGSRTLKNLDNIEDEDLMDISEVYGF
jgi:hypothetical protein